MTYDDIQHMTQNELQAEADRLRDIIRKGDGNTQQADRLGRIRAALTLIQRVRDGRSAYA